ncbi:polyA polymerase family protein [Histomonas meleagridis]|uniref:polyA polymerase family protein n=1 Tax=Histomonas meleagridis TaxID=135588 RepID=UPI00355A467C|nr:polyA polymerase family protein [Histomonas meleagridis]KAH0801947.1 polyA polymerase family protein [Histomonas meleagridis]
MDQEFILENIKRLESEENLTQQEKNAFELLRNVCNHFNPPVIVRAVGGWVRDKILGMESDDLDVSVENASGPQFALKMQELTKAKVQTNPSQSEHLESAKICLFGDFWIDVCQLRCDEYSEDSRIPNIRIGTPAEDSLRRDVTINSLFYNINERKVEDFQTGIQDITQQIIRTTYDPRLSFSDDPLRILRSFRFASRFSFDVDPEIITAAQSVKEDFSRKLTKPRIELELAKALKGPNPFQYVRYLIQSQLFYEIFDSNNEWNLNEEDFLSRASLVEPLLCGDFHYPITLATVYCPIYRNENVSDPINRRKKIPPLECALLRNLHVSTEVYHVANSILLGSFTFPQITQLDRLTCGRWIRATGKLWKFSRLLIFEEGISNFFDNEFVPFVESENLCNVYEIKPLLNGKDLAKVHNVKPGPQLAQLINELIDWQILNPSGTVDDYIQFVHNNKL